MPTKRFALQPGEPERLEVSWKFNWKQLSLSLDGTRVGEVETSKELRAGRSFALPDGTTLEVKLRQSPFPELELLRNGKPVPGSGADPQARLAMAYGLVFFVAGLSVALGVIAELFAIDLLRSLGMGVGSIMTGAVYAVLGYFVVRRSMLALITAIVLFALDGVLGVVMAVEQGLSPPAGGLITRILLLYLMIRGVPAIRALKQART